MKKRIFLIEDDPDASLLFKRLLTTEGYEVETEPEGNKILNTPTPPADLYILDNCLPQINGTALAKFLRLQAATKTAPILIISVDPSVCAKAKKCGASAFLAKPFEIGVFLQIVERLLTDITFQFFEAKQLRSIEVHN